MSEIGSVKWKKKDLEHFFPTLKKRVDGYFSGNKIKKQGNTKLYIKAIALLVIYVTPFILLLTVPLPVFAQLLLWALMGFDNSEM